MIRFVSVTILALTVFPLWAQSTYPVPKYAKKFSLQTKDKGPRPGSRVPNSGAEGGEFQRTYLYPAGLRLLVRAPCGSQISQKDLVAKAELMSKADGGPVQIDWEPVGDKDVLFWAVLYSRKETHSIAVRAEDGKYKAAGEYHKSESSSWHIEKLTMQTAEGLKSCFNQDEVESEKVRKAVLNILIAASLRNFRGQPSADGI